MSEDLSGPVVGRRRLTATLRRVRTESGLTQESVAAEMDWSLSKLIRIEKGSVGISTSDLKSLLRLYGIDKPEQVDGLVRLAKLSKERTWWTPYREYLPSPSFEKRLGLEAEAKFIEIFQPSLIPGLLQTPAYMRHVLHGITSELTSKKIAQVREEVRRRQQQAVLDAPDPPGLRVVLDEATLRRIPGQPDALRDQLQHIADLTERAHVSVQVIPYSAGPYIISNPFTIISFDDDSGDSAAVYTETAWSDELIEREDLVSRYRVLLDLLRQRALDPAASEQLIRKIADEFR